MKNKYLLKEKINRRAEQKENIFYYEIVKNPLVINRNGWQCRESILNIVNKNKGKTKIFTFKYYQGLALEEKPSFFEIMHCLLDERKSLDFSLDDFLKEFGYCDSLEKVREGESIYNEIIKNTFEINELLKYKKQGFKFYNVFFKRGL